MALYRETVQKNYSTVILILSVILSINIFISDSVAKTITTLNYIRISKMFFTGVMICFILMELYKANIKYKYTIIAHELIIHRIVGHREIEVEKIDITTIQIMEKCQGIYAINPPTFKANRYLASSLNGNKHFCVYKKGDKIRKFYFAPTEKLMSKLRKYNIG